MRSSRYLFLYLVLLLTAVWPTGNLNAQVTATPIQCGTILEAEFTSDNTTQNYTIRLAAGDTLTLSAEPIGAVLDVYMEIHDPSSRRIWGKNGPGRGGTEEVSIEVSATGLYTVNALAYNSIGAYTLYVGCTLRIGTVISPGDVVDSTPTSSTSVPPLTLPADSPGFPGLPSIDMSNAVKLPLIVGTPMTGIVTPTGNDVLGFSLEVQEGSTLELSFSKLSGNLNLGVVVLSPDNRVVFYGGLVLSDSLSTRFMLQEAGQYTIGVFRVELLPPDAPEATAFQVQGAINP